MAKYNQENLNEAMLGFVGLFSRYLHEELQHLQEQLQQIPLEVVSLAQQINTALEKQKQEADKVLEDVYLAEDAGKGQLFNTIQNQVDDVFKGALKNPLQKKDADAQDETLEEVESRFRRFGGIFSKHMESLSTLGTALNKPLLELMGILSSDDIMTQKFMHARESLLLMMNFIHACEEKLGKNNLNTEVLDELHVQLIGSTRRVYSMVDERKVFKKLYGD